jgi:two-component system NarL family response regulator
MSDAPYRPITGEALHSRHRRALVLIANGCTNAGIAEAMQVSENTAEFYVKQILARLGARDRAHAVALALRHGYIGLADVTAHPELPAA